MPHIIRANIIRRGNKVHCIFHKTIFTTVKVPVKRNFVVPWLQNLATISYNQSENWRQVVITSRAFPALYSVSCTGLLRDLIGSFEFCPYCDWPLQASLTTIATRWRHPLTTSAFHSINIWITKTLLKNSKYRFTLRAALLTCSWWDILVSI